MSAGGPVVTAARASRRRWNRCVATREAILTAARDAFAEMGWQQSSVTDIVARSGVSVGSIYHHFGGKPELFVVLWEEYDRRTSGAARHAVATVRADGERDRRHPPT